MARGMESTRFSKAGAALTPIAAMRRAVRVVNCILIAGLLEMWEGCSVKNGGKLCTQWFVWGWDGTEMLEFLYLGIYLDFGFPRSSRFRRLAFLGALWSDHR
jgi:hypothetical protein